MVTNVSGTHALYGSKYDCFTNLIEMIVEIREIALIYQSNAW